MDGQVIFLIALITVPMDIGWLYLGSCDAVEQYRDEIKRSKDPMPIGSSFSFSSGSAFTIFMMSVLIGGCLLDSNGIVTTQSVDAFMETHGLWVFIGTLFTFFGIFVTACEWLLRKMARCKEPNIRFERWFCLR